ncbi:MAG TPA: hypothetical protein VJ826_11205, partial [Candidatus Polarisedimenticolaceae bacterium]|nr:hypothetical protein [Candidatus Polarisedimenticolaceae bacterium]
VFARGVAMKFPVEVLLGGAGDDEVEIPASVLAGSASAIDPVCACVREMRQRRRRPKPFIGRTPG